MSIQNVSAGATAGMSMVWITSNATALSVLITLFTGAIFAAASIWNAYSNYKRNHINHREIVQSAVDDMERNGATPEQVENFKKYLRR